jgi:uncharacterized protein DUF6766
MRRFLKENGLSLVFLLFFVLAVAGQAFSGWHDFNDQALAHQETTISLGRYLTSSAFGNALLENWQSEYLQFTLYILLTVWFIQRAPPSRRIPTRPAASPTRTSSSASTPGATRRSGRRRAGCARWSTRTRS